VGGRPQPRDPGAHPRHRLRGHADRAAALIPAAELPPRPPASAAGGRGASGGSPLPRPAGLSLAPTRAPSTRPQPP
jgi:hypothetical protein